jgi:sugar phosphate permease
MASTGGSVSRPGSTRRTNVRWIMVFVAFLGLSINYIDRANLSVAVPYLDQDLNLGPGETGLILGAFGATGTYVTGLVTAGFLAIVGGISYLVIVGRVEPLPTLEQTSRPGVS